MPATFTEHEVKAKLTDKKKLSTFLDRLVHNHLEGIKKVRLNYILCSDDYLLDINIKYLNHNTLTDIITFDLSEGETDLTGEIYVSVDRVGENAEKFGVSYADE